jgi:FAD/FMN-containing dehydrogenase
MSKPTDAFDSRPPDGEESQPTTPSRRRLLLGGAGAAAGLVAASAVGWTPGTRAYAGTSAATIPAPPNFPSGISLYQQTYTNWAQEISVPNVWTCSPQTAADVVTLANWAVTNGFRLRPLGSAHGFAPTILSPGSDGANFVLVNTTEHLTSITVNGNSAPGTVTCQVGAQLEDVAQACESHNLGFLHTTAPGDVTVGGAMAMNTHGTAIPATGETLARGHSFGSLSNLILSLTAVVWSPQQSQYVLRTFARTNPAIGPLLTHVGRAFVTDVELQMGPNLSMQCISRTDISTTTLFAAPNPSASNTFTYLLDHYGHVEVIWFPFSTSPWVKLWKAAPTQPFGSKAVTGPYNYPFTDNTTLDSANSTNQSLINNPSSVPGFNTIEAAGTILGITTTTSGNLWGPAHDLTFYVKPTTIRVTTAAWGVLTARSNVQKVVSDFNNFLHQLVTTYQSNNQFPYTGPIELRAQGLDQPSEVIVDNAVQPYLSGARPVPGRPDLNVLLWFAVNNNVNQPGAVGFNQQVETWFLTHFGPTAVVRPEWTKAYAFTAQGGWTNTQILQQTFPNTFRANGYPFSSNWDAAVRTLNSYDPHRIFTNQYLDILMPG